ncbi:hypothetical protein [Saccharopolyspora cebuensis]|uniref:Uncharacterized protein n=1 Tax=Saccharopolyspora cebuensis TaxID=418759 RepID=A0ABV4CM59_9PSEU
MSIRIRIGDRTYTDSNIQDIVYDPNVDDAVVETVTSTECASVVVRAKDIRGGITIGSDR